MDGPTIRPSWWMARMCATVYCSCGFVGHLDANFGRTLRCADCGADWELPSRVNLEPAAGKQGRVQLIEELEA